MSVGTHVAVYTFVFFYEYVSVTVELYVYKRKANVFVVLYLEFGKIFNLNKTIRNFNEIIQFVEIKKINKLIEWK